MARFGNSAKAQEVFNDVCDGIRQYTSVGYDWTGIVNQTKSDDGQVTTRYRWRPTHVAIVPVPADTKSGIGRTKRNMIKITNEKELSGEISALAKGFVESNTNAASEIRALQSRVLGGEIDLDTFKREAMDACARTAKPKNQIAPVMGHELGMSKNDINSYSFRRAFLAASDNKGKPKDCFEADVSQQVERNMKTSSEGFLVPLDIMLGGSRRNYSNRDMSVGVFGQGGALVPTTVETPVIEVLRNRTACMRLGALVLAGLSGNVAIPRQTSTATAYSLPETSPVATSSPTLDQVVLVPHRVSSQVVYSRQLLIQSGADVEGLIRTDAMRSQGVKIDWLALNGGGGPDEPVGILNQPGVGSLTFGGPPTWASILAFEASLGGANADFGRLGYIMNSNARYALKQTAKLLIGASTVVAMQIFENPGNIAPDDEEVRGIINGYTALATNQLNGPVVFGNWMDLVIGIFGGLDIIFDPYTKAGTGQNVFTINSFVDTALRHAQSFCVSTDSGAQ
jgi:HK97 family phage major capsid protein